MHTDRTIQVIKRDHAGRELLRYAGRVLVQDEARVVLEAHFGLDEAEAGGLVFRRGDRMVETFYFARWYNVFAVYAVESDVLKGWYCNIGYPAVLEDDGAAVSYRDLALDVVGMPDGGVTVLDEAEFAALGLDEDVREAALGGLREVEAWLVEQVNSV